MTKHMVNSTDVLINIKQMNYIDHNSNCGTIVFLFIRHQRPIAMKLGSVFKNNIS